MICKSPIIDWEEYVSEFENYSINDHFIFRGQSNSVTKIDPCIKNGILITTGLNEWELESSFNRYYNGINQYQFSTFLGQQLQPDLFNSYYKHYEFSKKMFLDEMDMLNKLYFLQHYGCPTCLIDFTKDPLIALYFSLTSIRGSSGSTLDGEGNNANYSNGCFLSVYKIDCKILREDVGIKDLQEGEDIFLKYNEYKYKLDSLSGENAATVALLTAPKFSEENINLKNQKGCFLLYDNHGFYYKGKGFERFIEEYVTRREIVIEKPVIHIYRIRYNSIFKNRRKGKAGLFSFLKEKKITGATLFNDIQGLRYDFNYFHQL